MAFTTVDLGLVYIYVNIYYGSSQYTQMKKNIEVDKNIDERMIREAQHTGKRD